MLEPTLNVKEIKADATYGEFVIEPLEPGYGHTLGNSLRRVLLASIPGAAVTSVKINGVKHKFSTVPGLKENIIDLLLNIKELNIRLSGAKTSSKLTLSVKGERRITAADLEGAEDVEVINKDLYLASLSDSKAKLEMELTVERGMGYSLSEERKLNSVGVISADAIFTPVRRVNYEVSATRVGRQTNLDKLTLYIWTNGAVAPKEALDEASRILSSYFAQIYNPTAVMSEGSTKVAASDGALKLTVDELDLPTRIYNSLRNGGIETIGQILETPRKELISMRNMGAKSISIIEEKLKEKGVELN